MGFGFFKKKGNGNKKRKNDQFDPTQEPPVGYDEFDSTGEFLDDESSQFPSPAME